MLPIWLNETQFYMHSSTNTNTTHHFTNATKHSYDCALLPLIVVAYIRDTPADSMDESRHRQTWVMFPTWTLWCTMLYIFLKYTLTLSLCRKLKEMPRAYTTTKTLICPGWETAVVPVSQPGTPVRDKRGCPFVPGVATGTKGLFFFHVFLFSILFLFQLYFCISIKLMYWNSVCMISTNIYIYI